MDVKQFCRRLQIRAGNKIYRALHPGAPWLTPGAIRHLDSFLRDDMSGFEWGSGKSTSFFARRVKSLVSIEHDEVWYHQVKELLKRNRLESRVEYRLIKPNPHLKEKEHNHIKSLKEKWYVAVDKPEFYTYFSSILAYPDGYFDFVLIDGRARVECMMCAREKIKTNGIVILDNSERERYTQAYSLFTGWDKVETSNGLWETTIWIRKS